ncbi:hypothetical protein C4D60_Mb08t16780 [Musa balbisiana]|uniref:Uncharacterized protein n=1 Tax=Musa balbisiana TaxID=52838 RepID=A0A4V4H8Z8_MUSBA|nr:hypothetical protein C4D60_Mb08t16780 [Musa balbisiana]
MTFRPLSQRQQGAERSTTSSRKVVQVSSLSTGSKPFEIHMVPRDLVQMKEAHDCSFMVTYDS